MHKCLKHPEHSPTKPAGQSSNQHIQKFPKLAHLEKPLLNSNLINFKSATL